MMTISEFFLNGEASCINANNGNEKGCEIEKIKGWTVSNGTVSFSAIEFGCTITNLFVPDKTVAFFYFYFDFFIRLPDGYGVMISVFHHDAFHDSLAADV